MRNLAHGADMDTLYRLSVPPADGAEFLMGRWGWVAFVHWLAWIVLRVYAAFRPRVFLRGANVTRYFLTSRPADGHTGPGPGWYLHKFHGPDVAEEEHNHPWSTARTRILRGGYIEVRDGEGHVRLPGDVVTLRPWDFHRVAAVKRGTWTLFYAGRKTGLGWGFLTAAGEFRRPDAERAAVERHP